MTQFWAPVLLMSVTRRKLSSGDQGPLRWGYLPVMATWEMSLGDMASRSSIGIKSTSLWTTGPAVSAMVGEDVLYVRPVGLERIEVEANMEDGWDTPRRGFDRGQS